LGVPDRGKDKHLPFNFYPKGKSKSDQYLIPEGGVHSSLETGPRDWHFKFKLPDDHASRFSAQFETLLC
jgi:hypothetical protein